MARRSEAEEVLQNVLLGAFTYVDGLQKEIDKLDLKHDGTDSEENLSRSRVITLTLLIINDVIHPAHKICYKYFKGCDEMFDQFVDNHKRAVEAKLIKECECSSCKTKK